MRALVIDGARVVVGDRELVGAGGEAEVFALPDGRVAKVFTAPNALHERKVAALRGLAPALPAEVVAPDAVVADERGDFVGYAMARVPSSFVPLAELLRRPSFAVHGLPARAALLGRLFDVAHRLHALGVVIGDLSDQNVLVEPAGAALRVIDADSFQIGSLACPVQTDAYVDPLSPRTGALAPADDEYALHVLAVRLLLGVHPWGGSHATLTTIEARARARVFVVDPEVTYPAKVAQPARSVGAPLLAALSAFFRDPSRPPVPRAALDGVSLCAVRCAACGASGVPDAGACPSCSARATSRVPAATRNDARELPYPIEWLDAVGDSLAAVARGPEGAWVHVSSRGTWRALPRAFEPGLACALLDETRVAVAWGDRLEVWSLASGELSFSTTTARGWVGPLVARLGGALVRATGARLVVGDSVLGRPVERVLCDVVPGQARLFSSAPGAERILVATRLGRQVLLERVGPRGRASLPLSQLSAGESLLELDVLDDGTTTLCARLTRDGGATLVRHDLFGARGNLVASSRVAEGSHPARVGVTGRALRGAVLLHPTSAGLVREELTHGRVGDASTIDGTRDVVDEGALLVATGDGLRVALDRVVRALRPGGRPNASNPSITNNRRTSP